ncbi:Ger(x)C family spore germination protein [Paenibacillus ginsengarvi]|uniref:Ger(X)C family spore germination protein n=1 Tax=Paenibacillus ginsengarvi TaxID=400777 RepID=A0A3B0AU29_9BACL|nr:Ger(x)C family spore germination protein [Paenibacillus ginsengarvi]RKN64068.1 Ger(x)C family spore germination protein [Paenibacillus ginsengarvi]
MRRFQLAILASILLVTCTGCWDKQEINDIALVMATSIDMNPDGEYRITSQYVIPVRQIGATPTKEGGGSFMTETATGRTIDEIVKSVQSKLSRKMFVAHRRVVFIGEKLAKHGIEDILDYFSRNSKSRLRTYVLVVKGRSGVDLLNTDYPLEFIPTEAVREMENLDNNVPATLRDVISAVSSDGLQPATDVVELVEPVDGSVKSPNSSRFRVSKTAVFKHTKLLGYLNETDTQYYKWLAGRLRFGLLTVEMGKSKDMVSVAITKPEKTIKTSVNGGEVTIDIHLKGKGNVQENNTRLDLTNPELLRQVESEASRKIQQTMQRMVEHVQETYSSDIFGFGEELHRQHKKDWKTLANNWDQTFKQARVTVTTDFHISSIGMTGPPLQLKEREIEK